MAHTHDVYDTGKRFEINGISRFINETSATKLVLVQGDHKSEVITFEMPRYIDGHDMLLCNKIRVHYINIETKTNNASADIYEVTDLKLCEDCGEEETLLFTWTIEAPATKYFGSLSFLVKFECTEGDNILYQWNTAKYVGVNVLAGIDNSEEFAEKYSNVLEQWYNELINGADSIEELKGQALSEIEFAKEDAKNDIENKADSTMDEMELFSTNAYNSFKDNVDEKARKTLASIPEDYSKLDAEVKNIDGHIDSAFELFQNETKAITPTIAKKEMWKVTNNVVERAATNSTAYCLCEPIEVTESTLCEVTVQSYTQAINSVIVVDENYIVLYSYNANLTEIMTTKFRTPIGAKYLLINTSNPTSVVPKPTISITSYKETADNETVTDMRTAINNLFNNSIQNISQIKCTLKGTKKVWSVENDKIVLRDTNSTGNIACNEIPIKYGQIITVESHFMNSKENEISFAIVDSDYNVLYATNKIYPTATVINETVIAPVGSAYVVINAMATIQYSTVTIRDTNVLSGKTVAVIGDSISTNKNFNAVEMTITEEDIGVELSAYLTYYDVNTNALSLGGHIFTSDEIGTEVTFTPTAEDVGKVIGAVKTYYDETTTTWWQVAQEDLGFSTVPVCWSGASITSHESNTDSLKCAHAWHDSQIRKCGIRTPGTMERTAPDIIIIFRGCNDMTHAPYTKLTEDCFDGVNFEYPTTDQLSDGGYGFKEGYVLLISKLRERYPDAKIFLCTLSVFKRVNYSKFPTNNGINTLPQYNNAIREIADYMGCGLIEFDKCGITFENCYSEGYIVDNATTPTHPSAKGHMLMANKAIHDLRTQYIAVI